MTIMQFLHVGRPEAESGHLNFEKKATKAMRQQARPSMIESKLARMDYEVERELARVMRELETSAQ